MSHAALVSLASKLAIAAFVAFLSWAISHLPLMPSWEITWLAVVTLHVIGHDKDIWEMRSHTERGQG